MSTRTKRAPAARRDARRKQRSNDAAAIVLFTAGVVVAGGLMLADSGVVGQAAADFFRLLFGVGAWLAPVALWVFGGALAFERRLRVSRFIWGCLIILIAVLGFEARTGIGGSWFDPTALTTGGGYVGAVLRFVLAELVGRAAPFALGAIVALGIVTATNIPVFKVIEEVGGALVDGVRNRLRKRRLLKSARPTSAVVRAPRARALPEAVEAPAEPSGQEKATALVRQAPKPPKVAPADLEGEKREGYVLPPLTLLHDAPQPPKAAISEVGKKIEVLERTLDEFGIVADVVEVAQGPTVTRYEIRLGPGIKVSKIVSLADNLAMSLAAIGLRLEAPIPGKSAIGVEVPNDNPAIVSLKEILAVKGIMDLPDRLIVALGKDVGNEPRSANLAKMPHVLIGGATNAGKSVGLAAFIASLLMRNTPKDVRLVLIDPKRVELSLFDGVPHLMCPVVRDVKKAGSAFKAVLHEMDRRYDVLSDSGARNIDAYNSKSSYNDRLPYIVVVVDELADLMMQSGQEIEHCICRLAQLARATGIHLVLATQRPSVDVITGTIKANISSRIAFAVSSSVDSRTILDQTGADRLIGNGDMLYLPIDAAKPARIQGCYISEADIAAIVNHWRQQEEPEYTLQLVDSDSGSEGRGGGADDDADDPLYLEAVRTVVNQGQASTSMLQRRFKIGFQRAARLVDIMEQRGVVGPLDGPRPREILVSRGEWRELYGEDVNEDR